MVWKNCLQLREATPIPVWVLLMKLRLIVSTLLLLPTFAFGEAILRQTDIKIHRQRSLTDFDFLFGDLNLVMADGGFALASCLFHPSASIVPPNIFCPLGTTGFIAQGDVDADGIRDDGSFWSVSSVTPASDIEPFQTDRVSIIAAPPSGLADILRANDGDIAAAFAVTDFSVIIWYNYLAPPVAEFRLTRMRLDRPYGTGDGELQRMYEDLPWGNYLYEFPILGDPLRERVFGITHLTTPDVFPGRGSLASGWRLINDDWVGDALEIDPRLFYQFCWEGILPTNTVTSDQMFFSIRGDQDAVVLVLGPDGNPIIDDNGTPNDPSDDFLVTTTVTNLDTIVFPPYPFDTPDNQRTPFLLDNVFDPCYELAPFFFQPGDVARAELDWRRNIVAGSGTRDAPRRILRFDLRFIDTWDGFIVFSAPFAVGGFPFGTPVSERQRALDFDGDGFTNFQEYAFMSDLADPADMPQVEFESGNGATCTASVAKRPDVGGSLAYFFEESSDMGINDPWTVIRDGVNGWEITEDSNTTLTVTKVDPDPDPQSCFLRAVAR